MKAIYIRPVGEKLDPIKKSLIFGPKPEFEDKKIYRSPITMCYDLLLLPNDSTSITEQIFNDDFKYFF